MKASDRLIQRLEQLGFDLAEPKAIHRVGQPKGWSWDGTTWKWFVLTKDRKDIGSIHSVTDLAKAKGLEAATRSGQISIFPTDNPTP